MQNMDRKLFVVALLLPLFQGNEEAVTLTVCCQEGFGLDRFLKCTARTEHRKDLITEAVGHKNVTLKVLDSGLKVVTRYIDKDDKNSLTEDIEAYGRDHCLDFTINGSKPHFFPHKKANVANLNLSFYSCCEKGHILNTEDECLSSQLNHSLRVPLQPPGSLYKEFFELETAYCEFEVKKPNCSHMTRKYLYSDGRHCIKDSECNFPDFYVTDDGQLIMMNPGDVDEIIPKERFCLAVNEVGSTVAKVCHDDSCRIGNCLTKCCPKNKMFLLDEEKNIKCLSMESKAQEFKLEVKTASGRREPKTLQNYKFRFGFPNCPERTTQEIFDIERDPLRADLWFLRNGSLRLDRFDIARTFDVYCYDEAIDEIHRSTPRPVAILCLEARSESEPDGHHKAQGVAMIISCFFYALTIFAHVLLPPLWNLQGFTVVSQSLSLMLNFLVISYIKIQKTQHGEGKTRCRALALSAYYFFEASFAWLAVMSYDVYVALSGSSSGKSRREVSLKTIGLYSIIGWGIPATLILIADLIDKSHTSLPHYILRPYFAVESCWFYKNQKILSAYLYGPASIFLLINIVFFTIVARKLYVASGKSFRLSQADQGKGKERICAIFKLFVLMGITWIFEIISFAVEGNVYYWYFTDFLNIFMSVFVFILFICKKRILDFFGLEYDFVGKLLRRRFSWEPSTSAAGATSRYSKKGKLSRASNSATAESVVFSKTTSGV